MTKEENMWTISSGRTRKLRAALEYVRRAKMLLKPLLTVEYQPSFHNSVLQHLLNLSSLENSLEATSSLSDRDAQGKLVKIGWLKNKPYRAG